MYYELHIPLFFFTLLAYFSAFSQISQQPIKKQICTGSSTTLIVGTSVSGSSFQWQDSTSTGWVNLSNNTIFSGVTNDTLFINTPTPAINSIRFRCLVDSASATIRIDTSNSVTVSVLPAVISPTVGISQSICFNTQADTIRILQPATGADGLFTYQWQSSTNGTAWTNVAGFTGDSLLTGLLAASRFYRIQAVSTFGCGTFNSNQVLITVYPDLVPASVGNNQNICFNTSPTTLKVSTAPTGGGGVYSYQWQLSTDSILFNDIAGQTTDSLVLSNLLSSNYYRLQTISDSGCGTRPSNIIKINVYPDLVKSDINASNSTTHICFNTKPDTLTFNIQPSGGNGQFTHQWQSSADGISFVNISGATASKYNPGNLSTSTYYRVVSTSTAGCGTVISDTSYIHVYPNIQAPVIGTSQSICFNTQADTIRMLQPATGANGLFTYQWQSSPNGTAWSNVAGFTGDSLLTGLLAASRFYRIQAVSTFGCGTFNSNQVLITVYPNLVPATVGNSQNICFNTSPSTLKISNTPTGGGGVYSYQWQLSTDSILFNDIIGQTTDSLVIASLLSTRYYRLQTISDSGCGTRPSNIIKINVYPDLVRSDINASNTTTHICFNTKPDTLTFNIQPSGGNGQFTHQWQSSADGILFANISGATASKYNPGNLTTSTYYRVVSTSTAGCGTVISDTSYIQVYPNIQTPVIGTSQSICYNTQADTIRMLQPATGADGLFTYQWQSSPNGTVWTNVAGFTGDSLLTGLLSASRFYRIQAISSFGCGTLFSDSVFIRVYENLTIGNVSGNQNICHNTSPSIIRLATPSTGGGDQFTYQWQESSDSIFFTNLFGATNDSLSTGPLTTTTFYRLVSTSVLGCGQVTSNSVKVTVYDPFVIGSITGNDTVCYNFSPNSIKLSTPASGGDNSYTYQWLNGADTINWNILSGSISDVYLTGNLKVSTYYTLIISSGSGCGFDTTNWVYVKVNPLPDTASIIGNTIVCRNQRDLAYKRQSSNPNYDYSWSSSLGVIQYGINLDSCYLHWGQTSGIDSLKLVQTNPITGCTNTMILPVTIKDETSPNPTSIIRKPNSNILVCEDQQPGISYQWGYILKQTGIATDLPGANLQYVHLPFAFDTTIHIYYVRTTLTGCPTTSYFEYNPIPVGVEKIELTNLNFVVYPNPTNGRVYIKSDDKLENILVSDQNGRQIEFDFNPTTHVLELNNNLPAGIYFLMLQTKESSKYIKIVLTR